MTPDLLVSSLSQSSDDARGIRSKKASNNTQSIRCCSSSGGLIVKEAGKDHSVLCMINESKISGGLIGRFAGLRMEAILETQSKQVLQDYAKEIVKEISR